MNTDKLEDDCSMHGPAQTGKEGPVAPDNGRLGYRCGENPSPRLESFGKGRVERDKLAAGEDGSSDMTSSKPESWAGEE